MKGLICTLTGNERGLNCKTNKYAAEPNKIQSTETNLRRIKLERSLSILVAANMKQQFSLTSLCIKWTLNCAYRYLHMSSILWCVIVRWQFSYCLGWGVWPWDVQDCKSVSVYEKGRWEGKERPQKSQGFQGERRARDRTGCISGCTHSTAADQRIQGIVVWSS